MNHKYLIFITGWFLLLASGCSTPTFAPLTVPNEYSVVPAAPQDEEDITERLKVLHRPDLAPYRISPGDQFNISVYEHVELNQLEIVVTPDGFISVPLVGPVQIGGLTLVEATDLLKMRMGEYLRKPIISLIPVRVNGYNYTIVGRVNYPGTYPISIGKTRVIDAIAAARGLAQGLFHGDTVELADLDNAYISRDGEILPVDFRKALLEGDPLNNIPLKNNDYIYIPSTMNSNVALLGEVARPTYVGYKEGMTLLQAIPFAQGLRETHSSEVRVIRGGMRNPVVYVVNVDRMLMGKTQDFALQANDIVYFPPDGLSEWNIMVRKILPTLQSLNLLAGPFGNAGGYMDSGF